MTRSPAALWGSLERYLPMECSLALVTVCFQSTTRFPACAIKGTTHVRACSFRRKVAPTPYSLILLLTIFSPVCSQQCIGTTLVHSLGGRGGGGRLVVVADSAAVCLDARRKAPPPLRLSSRRKHSYSVSSLSLSLRLSQISAKRGTRGKRWFRARRRGGRESDEAGPAHWQCSALPTRSEASRRPALAAADGDRDAGAATRRNTILSLSSPLCSTIHAELRRVAVRVSRGD